MFGVLEKVPIAYHVEGDRDDQMHDTFYIKLGDWKSYLALSGDLKSAYRLFKAQSLTQCNQYKINHLKAASCSTVVTNHFCRGPP